MNTKNLSLDETLDLARYPLEDSSFILQCKETINREGCLVLPNFLAEAAIKIIAQESNNNKNKAYYCEQEHSVYIAPSDENYPSNHPRNQLVISTKGCITDDQISENSHLKKVEIFS